MGKEGASDVLLRDGPPAQWIQEQKETAPWPALLRLLGAAGGTRRRSAPPVLPASPQGSGFLPKVIPSQWMFLFGANWFPQPVRLGMGRETL